MYAATIWATYRWACIALSRRTIRSRRSVSRDDGSYTLSKFGLSSLRNGGGKDDDADGCGGTFSNADTPTFSNGGDDPPSISPTGGCRDSSKDNSV